MPERDHGVTVEAPVSEPVDEAASKAAAGNSVEVRVLPGASFWKRVKKTDGCWLWTGHLDRDGYGIFRLGGRRGTDWRAHRLAYASTASIPTGAVVAHGCDNPACVNPGHLFVASQADNIADRDSKGRTQRGARHYAAKLTEADVRTIRADPGSSTRLGAVYGVSPRTINKIRCGTIWKHLDAAPQAPKPPPEGRET